MQQSLHMLLLLSLWWSPACQVSYISAHLFCCLVDNPRQLWSLPVLLCSLDGPTTCRPHGYPFMEDRWSIAREARDRWQRQLASKESYPAVHDGMQHLPEAQDPLRSRSTQSCLSSMFVPQVRIGIPPVRKNRLMIH